MKPPKLWFAKVTIPVEVMIASNSKPGDEDILIFALEEMSENGTDDQAIIGKPLEVISIEGVPGHLQDLTPWGPVQDNPYELSCEEILRRREEKLVKPFGKQLEIEVEDDDN